MSYLAKAADTSSHEVILGELATNAVCYGRVSISVKAALLNKILEIDIKDSGNCFALDRRLAEGPRTDSARGLSIVRCLAKTLEVEHSPSAPCRVTATIAIRVRAKMFSALNLELIAIGVDDPRATSCKRSSVKGLIQILKSP